MNEIQVFKNEVFGQIRTTEIDGSIWFVGKDVADALGYVNTKDAIATHVDNSDKMMGSENATPSITDSLGRKQYPVYINESGLYSLILSSKLPTAKQFKHWVTSEVLPSIRKHGLFAMDEVLANPDVLINALTELKKEREAKKQLEQENKQLNHALEYDKIKGWTRWNILKKEIKYKGSFNNVVSTLNLADGEDFERKVMGNDKYPTIMLSPETVERVCLEFN